MIFEVTSSQKNFLINSTPNLWNHGLICWLHKRYTYDELNNTFNSFVEKFDSIRLATNSNLYTSVVPFEKVNYPFMSFDNKGQLLKAANLLINKPIYFEHGLFRCIIFQTDEGSGYIVNAHHLILDGFSGQIMCDFLNTVLNTNIYLKPIEEYQHHVQNEEKYIKSKRYQKDKKFWSQQFSDNPQCSIFEEKKTSFDYESDEVSFRLDTNLFNRIKAFCDNNNVSVQSYFNTVYSVYIYKTLGIDFFTLGVPVLNRTTEAELNTIGLYMHIVPLVVKISDKSFLQNLIEIEDAQLTLFRHQKFTQHDIKELLKEKGKPQNSLFDIVTDYQEFPENEDYKFEFIYSNSLSVPLEIHMQSFGDKKHNLKIRYRTSMFTEKEIQTMLNSIIAIAEDAVENTDKKITELNMLSKEERQKILYSFNETGHTYDIPENATLYTLFEKTAKENEERICIRTAEGALTFGELLTASEKLDAKIRTATKEEKSVIAVMAERSAEMYAAIYGIIRGGNAYLPIDPEYPADRIEYMLRNSGAKAVAAQGKFAALAGKTPCIDMTELMKDLSEKLTEIPESKAEADDTAYVIYTSGSTGNPKGAKVNHKSAVNRILWMHDKYPLGKDDVILQKTPYTFDVSVWEHFWWGITGGSLAVSKPGEHFLPAKILEETSRNKVTHIHFVPSVFELFLNYLEAHEEEAEKFSTVKYVFLSGEALTANLTERFYRIYDYEKVSLHNLYGPTECAVDVTYYDCAPGEADPVPIGKPIYNTQMYVVDKYNNAVPVGVTGELCIAGMNVGQGYLNNPELTAERFIDNPFGEGKLYRTGDLAYWREDGNIVFAGRKDSQIKLNGQRVEIGEIESVISSLDDVESVAVLLRRVKGRDVLVAFYSGRDVSEEAIKDICRNKLPKYMVPSFAVRLECMPINKNGKLDRKALAVIDFSVPEAETDKPINDTEKYICRVFEDILGESNIGRNSDFFELGGTSYSMISLLSEEGFENVTAAEFMRNSTPAMLADVLSRKSVSAAEYLEELYIPENPKKALIILPFAAGGAEAFGNFVASLKKVRSDVAVYFIRYLHSYEECEGAAKEITELLKGMPLMFYSHCVGSALALQIISQLEKNNVAVEHYFAGASIPPEKPSKRNLWNYVPDSTLKRKLVKAGAAFDGISRRRIKALLKSFRRDTDFSSLSFYEFNCVLKTEVSVIINKKDIFTANYNSAEQLWNRYFERVGNICFIDSDSHYFQRDNSDELVCIIMSNI